MNNDSAFMRQALDLAQQAASIEEVPVGAIVVANGEVIGRGFNCPIDSNDPTAHAEIVAMRDAANNLGNYRLAGCELYVTIEPCTMCLGAMVHARIKRVIFGALEPRAGAFASNPMLMDADHFNHKIEWSGGVLEQDCSELIKEFFKGRRSK
ncbi:MAG: tRNA adenosine(34) deaminase TadA [Porticoccaceae bacterium]